MTHEDPGPIFVVGSMRSGSTMLRLMLDSHPRIAIPPESGFMGGLSATKRIPEWKFGEGWYERLGWSEAEMDEQLRAFYDGLFRRYASDQGKVRWGEKTPFHTSHMAQMAQVFPDASFVGIVRHPGAVATSLHQRFHYGFAEATAYWSDTNKDMLRAGIALGDRFTLCRYEDLVGEADLVLREVLELLGEPWAPEVTQHHVVQREKGAPRAAEGRTITSDPVDASRASAWAATIGVDARRELRSVGALAEFFGYDAATPEIRAAGPPAGSGRARTLTGADLALRRRDWPHEIALDVDRRPRLMDITVEELAARLTRTEDVLARTRSRRAVRVADAFRTAQHGRSRAELRTAWRVLRDALGGGRWR